MEEPTFTAIDYNSKENKVIEERIRNYYLPVKNTFEAVLYGRLNIPDSPRGLCADLMDVSRTISREFALVEEVFLWRNVIKPWFSLLLHLKNLKYTHDGRFSKAYQRGRGNPYAYRRDLE